MKLKMKKTVVAFTLLSTSAGVAYAACGGTEILILAALQSMTGSLVANIGTTGAQIVSQDEQQTERVISALKVITKQVQESGEQYVKAGITAEKSLASVTKDIADKELVDQVVVNFSSQGYDPCVQSAATKRVAAAENASRVAAVTRTRNEIEGAGGRYTSVADVLANRQRVHEKLFCTQDEVDAGMCSSVGKVPGGDSNAALIYSADASPDVVTAKNAVINNIIGLPDQALSPQAAATPEGQAYILEKKRKDSFLGFAAYSLKSIQSDNEQYKQEMDNRIGQFFGTDRAVAWAKDQAGQSPRGVMVDLLKIQGLQLKTRERRIKANMRSEANIAALLEIERQQTLGTLAQAASQQVGSARAVEKVK